MPCSWQCGGDCLVLPPWWRGLLSCGTGAREWGSFVWMRGRVCRCGRRVAVGHHPLGASGASSCYSLPSSSRSGLRACTPLLSCRLMVGTRVPSGRYARRRVVLPVRGRVQPGGLWWRLAGPTVYSLLGGGTWVCREVHHSAGGFFLLFFVGGGALRHCSLCARWKCASIGSVWLLISGMSAIFFVLWLCLPCSHAFSHSTHLFSSIMVSCCTLFFVFFPYVLPLTARLYRWRVRFVVCELVGSSISVSLFSSIPHLM